MLFLNGNIYGRLIMDDVPFFNGKQLHKRRYFISQEMSENAVTDSI